MPSTSKSSEDFVNVQISGNEITTEISEQTEKLTPEKSSNRCSASKPNLNVTPEKSTNLCEAASNSNLTENLNENMATPGSVASCSRMSMAELNISSDTLNEVSEQDFSCISVQDSPQFAYQRTSSPVLPPENSLGMSKNQSNESLPIMPNQKSYDYLLKVLLVGDSDVGKQEILAGLEDGTLDSPFCSSSGAAYKTTTILIDGKRVKLQLWDTSGQGRFCTIIRSYSRGAQGILLVYDITNKWSFEGIDRWLKEVDQHAPGIPKVLVGNRLHLAFKRQVDQAEAETYAERNAMEFFEVSPLVNFNISETFVELARMAIKRNGMERLWRSNKVSSLYEMCAHTIVKQITVYDIERLPLPPGIKENLKSYALTNYSTLLRHPGGAPQYKSLKKRHKFRPKTVQVAGTPADAVNTDCVSVSRKSCVIS